MTLPAIILWMLILYGISAPATFALYLYFGVIAFGGLSLLPPSVIGNVPPETVCTALLIFKTFLGRKRIMAFLLLALDMRKLGILTLFSVYVVMTAFLYPRLFAGKVEVYELNYASNLSHLGPSSANYTQTIYMMIAIGMAFVFAYSGQRPEFRRHFLYASLMSASLLLLSGLIDMVFGDFGREDLLAPFHNATYHLLDSVSVAGQKRVVGFMPEASVFGGACCASLGFLVFNRRVYEGRLRAWVVPAVTAGLAFMVYASTSSGAYIGIAVLAVVAVMKFMADLVFTERLTATHIRTLMWAIAAVFAGGLIYLVLPKSVMDHMAALVDASIFQKSSSFSYLQRNSWTRAGIAAFWQTDGIGVGVGSIRTSNWLVNFAASTGVIGLILFGGFVLRILFTTSGFPDVKSKQLATGLKFALVPGAVVQVLSGTTPNPGAGMMLALGMIYAMRQKPVQAAQPSKSQLKRNLPPSKTMLQGPEAGTV